MRAISPIGQYGIVLKHPSTRRGLDSTGTVVEYSEGDLVHAQFHKGGLTEWEEIEALESFDFSGLPEGINPLTRVSMFDTEAYVERLELDDAEREAVLSKLDAQLVKLSKVFPNEFKIVAKPAAEKPWPTYDVTPLEDVLNDDGTVEEPGLYTMQGLTGIDPQAIRLYEVENSNRPEVIEAMEALEAERAGATRDETFSVAL